MNRIIILYFYVLIIAFLTDLLNHLNLFTETNQTSKWPEFKSVGKLQNHVEIIVKLK